MPSPFSRGLQNADKAFELLTAGDIKMATVLLVTANTTVVVAHGMTGTPDFCLMGVTGTAANVAEGIVWSADATSITFTCVDTQASMTISYLAGNLS